MATITVTDLVLNFAAACRALVPSLERAGVPWRDGEQHDNWDRFAEPLFESLVTEPCAWQAVGEAGLGKLRIARYGFESFGNCNAYVALDGATPTWLIGLSSVAGPFDHAQCANLTWLGPRVSLVPLEGARFVFVYEADEKGQQRLDLVDLAAE